MIVAAVAAIVTVNPFASSPGPSSPGPVTPAPRVSTTVNPALAPAPPASGAYFGAWVGPDELHPGSTRSTRSSSSRRTRPQAQHRAHLREVAGEVPHHQRHDLPEPGQHAAHLLGRTDTKPRSSPVRTTLDPHPRRANQGAGPPVFLEWRWEMDRPNLRSQSTRAPTTWPPGTASGPSSPPRGAQRRLGVVPRPRSGFSDGRADGLLSRRREVNWICADAYPNTAAASASLHRHPFLSWASHHDKPVMIGEFGVPASRRGPAARAVAARGPAGGDGRPPDQGAALLRRQRGPAGPAGSYSLGGDAAALSVFRAIATDALLQPDGPADGH